MTETPARRRAPAMSTEQRRAMIVAAALPLVAESGAAVTTGRIARAAGIGEGTIFRVFTDKEELLDACAAEATDPAHVLRELASIPPGEPLEARLTEAAEALRAHLERMGAVVGTLFASGHRRERRPEPGSRETSMRMIREGVAELIEPDRAALRLAPEQVAAVFLGMLFTGPGRTGGAEDTAPSAAELVDVLLNGSARRPGEAA